MFTCKGPPLGLLIGISLLAVACADAFAASGRSQDEAIGSALNEICPPSFDGFFAPDLGPNLDRYCQFRRSFGIILPGAPGGDGGSATSHQTATERLSAQRFGTDQAEAEQTIAEDFRVFISFSRRHEKKTQTRLEPGLGLDADSALIGIERSFGKLQLGVALAQERQDGDYDNSGGGRLKIDSDHYLFYLNGTLGQAYWYGASVGWAQYDFDTLRRLRFDDTEATFADLGVDALVPSQSTARQTEARVDFGRGWDYELGYRLDLNAGLAYRQRRLDAFVEQGEVPLRLAFPQRSEHSLLGVLGLDFRRAISSQVGVWLPGVGLSWRHEFADDAQDIQAFFAEDGRDNPTAVVFSTDRPDRDSAYINVGVSWLGPRGWSADLRYRREFGYRDYARDGLSLMVGLGF